MVKSKRRQIAASAATEDLVLADFVQSKSRRIEDDPLLDEDWVIVKKQRITILIPPLQPSTPQGLKANRTQRKPPKAKTKRQTPISDERHPQKHSGDELHKSVVALASKVDIQTDIRPLGAPLNAERNLSKAPSRATPEVPSRLVGDSKHHSPSLHQVRDKYVHHSSSLHQVRDQRVWGSIRTSSQATVSEAFKAVNRPSIPPSIYHQGCPTPSLVLRSIGCLNIGIIKNKKLRASNLEKKLEKAGGLSRWLLSLGLGQFMHTFHGKNMDKYQLLNLTMAKLKDMGVVAVGPRRKLIHAIECLSQPYCLKTL